MKRPYSIRLVPVTLLLTMIFFAALAQLNPVASATITVSNTDDNGPGSLREAIAAAASGDTISMWLARSP